jgi:hypothetical protein
VYSSQSIRRTCSTLVALISCLSSHGEVLSRSGCIWVIERRAWVLAWNLQGYYAFWVWTSFQHTAMIPPCASYLFDYNTGVLEGLIYLYLSL